MSSDGLMRAVRLHAVGEAPRCESEVPLPSLGPGEVLVRVHAAALNAADWKLAEGLFPAPPELPITLGRDFAGVIAQTGERVFGFVPHLPLRHGSFAELTAVPASGSGWAALPPSLSFEVGAALAMAGSTALGAVQGVVRPGDRTLIVGAAGGVGSMAVQLAAGLGATVTAVAAPDDASYLRSLGADAVVARGTSSYGSEFDSLIDLAYAGDGFDALLDLVRRGGRAATVVRGKADPAHVAARGVTVVEASSAPSPERFERLARLAECGNLRAPITRVINLEEVPAALRALRTEHTRGKVAVSIA